MTGSVTTKVCLRQRAIGGDDDPDSDAALRAAPASLDLLEVEELDVQRRRAARQHTTEGAPFE